MLALLILICGTAGGFIWGWYAHAWNCRRINPQCPIWQAERDAAWKAELRRRYPGTRPERRGTTEVVTAELLAEQGRAGVPLARTEPTPTTNVTNSKRRTP
jgi:hypothetical protein